MNVASLELCKELYELSGWKVDQWSCHWKMMAKGTEYERYEITHQGFGSYPAYDLGYLLRKLPGDVTVKLYVDTVTITGKRIYYFVGNFDKRLTDRFDTPEDAAAKLAIELFKEGVLTPELSSKEKEL